MMNSVPSAEQRKLMKDIGFTARDLRTNYGGQLSKSQQDKLKEGITAEVRGCSLGLAVVFIVCYFAVGDFDKSLMIIGILIWLLLIFFYVLTKRSEVTGGTVASAEGLAEIVECGYDEDGSKLRCLKIANSVFNRLPTHVQVLFVEGQRYRVFYLPTSKRIVSAELLP